jgi:hypothetical protein
MGSPRAGGWPDAPSASQAGKCRDYARIEPAELKERSRYGLNGPVVLCEDVLGFELGQYLSAPGSCEAEIGLRGGGSCIPSESLGGKAGYCCSAFAVPRGKPCDAAQSFWIDQGTNLPDALDQSRDDVPCLVQGRQAHPFGTGRPTAGPSR